MLNMCSAACGKIHNTPRDIAATRMLQSLGSSMIDTVALYKVLFYAVGYLSHSR